MMEVLKDFRDMSGQSINFSQSKLFVSPNVTRRLSAISGISLTNDLGRYLGVPLLHNRVSKQHFNDLVEKSAKETYLLEIQ